MSDLGSAPDQRAAGMRGAESRRLREALEEIVRRERRSEYSSIYAAPTEFAAVAREALNQEMRAEAQALVQYAARGA